MNGSIPKNQKIFVYFINIEKLFIFSLRVECLQFLVKSLLLAFVPWLLNRCLNKKLDERALKNKDFYNKLDQQVEAVIKKFNFEELKK